MAAYYNEFKPEAAHMLRQLIKDGIIAPGDVDERSIVDVRSDDLKGYEQCHFFAGIGGWSVALRLALWNDARPVWTGSCPCQPFSTAGRQEGHGDERHLWPYWARLIRESKPATIFGEQVAGAITYGWLDEVFNDLEAEEYACAAAVLPACSVGKPHKRDRIWFVAESGLCDDGRASRRYESAGGEERLQERNEDGFIGKPGGILGDSSSQRVYYERPTEDIAAQGGVQGAPREQRVWPNAGESGDTMGNPKHNGWDGRQVARGDGAAIFNNAQGQDSTSEFTGAGQSKYVANAVSAGLQGHGGHEQQHDPSGREAPHKYPGEADLHWINCPDGKARPVKRGICLLAHGVQHRAPILHAFGNAIVPQVAAEFIKATM